MSRRHEAEDGSWHDHDRDFDRDRGREPRRSVVDRHERLMRHCNNSIKLAAAAMRDTKIVQGKCPACQMSVYAPADSEGERIDCERCGRALLTAQEEGRVIFIPETPIEGEP